MRVENPYFLMQIDQPNTGGGGVFMTACYLQNRLPEKLTEKTPYELWDGKAPNLSQLEIFRSKVYVHIEKEKCTTWNACEKEGVLVG